jgi:transposase-like protein
MRNVLGAVRRRDQAEVKTAVQAIYQAESARHAQAAFQQFQRRWRPQYPTLVKRLETDLPELLSFFSFPKSLWKTLRTTNAIERRFVEVRRRTRPMVCFVNIHSVDRIIFSIFNRFNQQWQNRTLKIFTQAA